MWGENIGGHVWEGIQKTGGEITSTSSNFPFTSSGEIERFTAEQPHPPCLIDNRSKQRGGKKWREKRRLGERHIKLESWIKEVSRGSSRRFSSRSFKTRSHKRFCFPTLYLLTTRSGHKLEGERLFSSWRRNWNYRVGGYDIRGENIIGCWRVNRKRKQKLPRVEWWLGGGVLWGTSKRGLHSDLPLFDSFTWSWSYPLTRGSRE